MTYVNDGLKKLIDIVQRFLGDNEIETFVDLITMKIPVMP